LRKLIAATVLMTAVVVLARWPVATAEGVNFHVSVKRITLFEKTIAFVERDLEMRRLTREIAGPGGSPEERLMRMYEWVTANIHAVPAGLPVVDNHVLYIFVRRYGTIDQRAEALAALASYDGMPATTIPLGKYPNRLVVQLTLVNLGDRLVLFDVNNRIVFRKLSGELATLSDVASDPSIVRRLGKDVTVDDVPYDEHFPRLSAFNPTFVRMEKQRFWARLKDELFERVTP
jgi:hypothetical protein